jgi:hypothetical protein
LLTPRALVLAPMESIDARIPSSHKARLKFEPSWKIDLLSVPLFFGSLVLLNPCHVKDAVCIRQLILVDS